MRAPVLALFSLCCLAAIAGCGGSNTPTGDQATVTGSVTKGGKPVALDTAVTFYCKDQTATAAGMVDTLGKFSLTPGDQKRGIPPGRYQVMIRPPSAAPVTTTGPDYEKMMKGGTGKVAKAEFAGSEIPGKLQALDTSGLVLEVKAGPNNFDIEIDKLN